MAEGSVRQRALLVQNVKAPEVGQNPTPILLQRDPHVSLTESSAGDGNKGEIFGKPVMAP